jgi:5-formyltetrahydrofolate cyclo-ligase
MRARRIVLARERPDAAETAAARLPVEFLTARVVGGYLPQGAEIDPVPLMRRFADAGATLALPVALAADAPLVFRAWSEGDALKADTFGIPAPAAGAAEARPDVIIAPVLAFDALGGRLGQGAGCFDRTLADLRASGAVFAIGLAFAGQEVAACPVEAHDQPLDAILTETVYKTFRDSIPPGNLK